MNKKNFWEFFQEFFPNKFFFHKTLRNSLYFLKVGNKHIEAENQFLFKLRKALIVLH